MKRIAIIGSGIGGMSAAIRLARKGFEVDVFEQNPFPGGKAHSVITDGFRFDAGPSLLTMPFVIKELFDFAGEDMNDFLRLRELDVLCRYFYSRGEIINAYKDTDRFGEEIDSKTIDTASDLIRFLDYAKGIYTHASDIFLFGNLYSIWNYLKLSSLRSLLNIFRIDAFRTMDKAIRSFFSDKKLIQLFSRYATYNGSSPYLAPATLNIIAYVENVLGGYYTEGGMQSLTGALFKLSEKKGVRFHFGKKISKINVNGSKVCGIELDDGSAAYDIIVSNADSIVTNEKLLGQKIRPAEDKNISSSAVVFYWGVKGVHRKLGTHNILFSSDYPEEFEHLFGKKECFGDPTVYIYISSKFTPEDAPEGHENWFVMVNAPVNTGQDWNRETGVVRDNILKKIMDTTGIDIRKKIVTERVLHPAGIESATGCYKGAIYGFSSNSRTSAFMRQSNSSVSYKGLYYCGGSTHPGGGIPLVMLSGKLAAELIMSKYSKKLKTDP